jgi:peptide chain release factor 1
VLPITKLKAVKRRYQELEQLMCDPAVHAERDRITELNRERSQLSPVVEAFDRWNDLERRIAEDREALSDPDLGPLAEEEIPQLEAERSALEQSLRVLLLPRDPNDDRNTLLEIRAGTGGEEAAIFAGDLFRMYTRYADGRGWKVEIISTSEAGTGAYKELIALVSGSRVFSSLKHEGGVHRVQRVPATEAQGRIHTSTATVAVLPEADDVEVQIDDKDLRYDIAASGGPGGQGVNTTNSAVQITHLPTGLIVKCQDERSQIKNRARALKVLKSRLLEIERTKQQEAIQGERRGMVGAGERAEKIRTYNYPQNRVTDHRIQLTLHKLDRVMAGELDDLIDALVASEQAERLKGEE